VAQKGESNSGEVLKYNGQSKLSVWGTDECNSVGGNYGFKFPPEVVAEKSKLEMFVENLCRKFPLVYEGNVRMISYTVRNNFRCSIGKGT
jgi:hypothetical protein